MNLTGKAITAYAEEHTAVESDVLRELNSETYKKTLNPQMLAGHLQGALISMLSRMIKPSAILEIGTFTGYSAICLAEGLQDGGVLHTIDNNEELEEMALRYFRKAGIEDKVHLHIGNALEVIPGLDRQFDLVYIDADKENYARYYDLVFDKVRKEGFIIADNALWGGKVVEDKKDKETQAIDSFNKKVRQDKRVENVLLPVRDGLMIIRKK